MESLSPGPLSVEPVDRLPDADVERLEAAYVEAFPAELRAPFADLYADHVLAFRADDAPVGLAVVRDLPDGSVFLRYFLAVRRGGGDGTRMWAALEDWARARSAGLLLLDVEDPDEEVDDAEESAVRRRRVAFYERNGVQVLPVDGYAPDHGTDLGQHAPAMRLLLAEVDVAPDARQPLPEERLRGVVLLVLTGRYGYAADDPTVLRLLATNGLD